MDISEYYLEGSDGAVSFTEEQASTFAKRIAGDFNPIHNPGHKHFCVPGDLLFTVMLRRYGAADNTSIQFSGMLDARTRMLLPPIADTVTHVVDARGRALLSLSLSGRRFCNESFLSQLTEQYVRFSGQTFPDILVPLMRGAGVMINPERPLAIYRDMAILLNDAAVALFDSGNGDRLEELRAPLPTELSLKVARTDIRVNGRKAVVSLGFNIDIAGDVIGCGEKNMMLSGLRDYEEAAMQSVVEQYTLWRQAYGALARAV